MSGTSGSDSPSAPCPPPVSPDPATQRFVDFLADRNAIKALCREGFPCDLGETEWQSLYKLQSFLKRTLDQAPDSKPVALLLPEALRAEENGNDELRDRTKSHLLDIVSKDTKNYRQPQPASTENTDWVKNDEEPGVSVQQTSFGRGEGTSGQQHPFSPDHRLASTESLPSSDAGNVAANTAEILWERLRHIHQLQGRGKKDEERRILTRLYWYALVCKRTGHNVRSEADLEPVTDADVKWYTGIGEKKGGKVQDLMIAGAKRSISEWSAIGHRLAWLADKLGSRGALFYLTDELTDKNVRNHMRLGTERAEETVRYLREELHLAERARAEGVQAYVDECWQELWGPVEEVLKARARGVHPSAVAIRHRAASAAKAEGA